MFLKQNIPKIKHLLKSVPLLLVTLAITLSITPIQVHADNLSQAYDNWAASIVDSQGVNSSASTTTVPYGVSTSRTGYLCYLLDKNGNKAADFAVAYKSPGFEFYDGSTTWIAESRKGGYKVNIFKNEPAPWNCTPWTAAGDDSYTTNEPQIKAWFESMDGNVQNAAKFIADNWGHDMSLRFGDEEVYLVIETLMHFRYSKQTSSTTQLTAEENFRALKNRYMGMPISQLLAESPTAVQDAFYNGIIYDDEVRGGLIKALQKRYDEDPSQFEPDVGHKWYCISGNLVGTVPNLIEYRNNVLQSDTRVFNKFTHKIAPFAEYIQQGNIGSQIGFLPWSGDTSNQITDSDVLNYGVAMMVISARPSGQTTCDESKLPAPHAAPKESEGNVSIIKSYRTRQGTKYTDDGTHTLNNVNSNITIENEKLYQVVGWAISSSTSPTSSINWNPPSVLKQGTTPSTVNLDPTKGEIGLYLLLEKQEKEPQKVEDYNYLLTQSTIQINNSKVYLTNQNKLTNQIQRHNQSHIKYSYLKHPIPNQFHININLNQPLITTKPTIPKQKITRYPKTPCYQN